MAIPSTTKKRLISAVPKFSKILAKARKRDINEADTVEIVSDILHEVFGFDKYEEITREFAIKGTYCDLAVKNEKHVEYLIEVKAIGTDLKDSHLRQAVTYASQEGIPWVVLTNGIIWKIYRVQVKGRVESKELVVFDLVDINPRRTEDQEILFLLCKRGIKKNRIDEFYEHTQSVNRYTLAAVLLTEPVIKVILRELKRTKDGLKVDRERVEELISKEVLKRDLVESETAKKVAKSVKKALEKNQRKSSKTTDSEDPATS